MLCRFIDVLEMCASLGNVHKFLILHNLCLEACTDVHDLRLCTETHIAAAIAACIEHTNWTHISGTHTGPHSSDTPIGHTVTLNAHIERRQNIDVNVNILSRMVPQCVVLVQIIVTWGFADVTVSSAHINEQQCSFAQAQICTALRNTTMCKVETREP